MKKFFMFAAMASVALASCVKNEPVATVEQGDAILFNSPVVAPATKADQVAYTGGDFNVYGYYSTADAYDGAGSVYINDAVFTEKSNSYFGGKNKTYFWPKNGHLNFVAYAPSAATGLTVDKETATDPAVTGPNALVLDYVVQNAADVDLLYSDWALKQTSANYVTNFAYTGVDIAFHHALSQVKFTVKGTAAAETAVVKVGAITLTGLVKEGSLNVPYNAAAAAWTPGSETDTYTVSAAAADAASATALTQAGSINKTFLLLPQALTNAVLNVTYYIPSDDPSGYTAQTTTIELDTAKDSESHAIETWAKEISYNYTIVFDVNEVKLAPVVEADWTPVNSNVSQVL